jgi:hypothetical protein
MPTWNDRVMTRRCIESLLQSEHGSFPIVVVDNGSSFPVLEPLKEEFPDIEAVRLDKNRGFTGGCNRGIEKALDLGADYVFLLNNDTIVHPKAIDELVEAMESRKDAAMASAVILFPGDEQRIQCYQAFIDRDRAWISRPGENDALSGIHRRTVETGFAPACAVMFRRKALSEVGLFDERLFMNWEDYDICLRLTDAGWKLLTVGTAEVIHMHGQSQGTSSPFVVYFGTRNRFICLFRHGSLWGILRNSPFIARSLYWKMRSFGLKNVVCQKAFMTGILHFVTGIRGETRVTLSCRDINMRKK